MRGLWTVYKLTLHEARQRRILLATLICGGAFLALYGLGFHFVHAQVIRDRGNNSPLEKQMILLLFTVAGLYGANFLTLMTAMMMPVDTLSGEIGSGVMQTVASKPIRRSAIVLGKWLAHATVLAGYLLLMAGGVLAIARIIGHILPPNIVIGLPLMFLEGMVLLTLCIAGGTRLSTITTGIAVLGLYGLSFIGGWTEQIGTMAGNATARSVGTAASLVMPSESLWQLAAWHMQPSLMREMHMGPFTTASVPNTAMVAWACGYILVTLLIALRSFEKRPL